MKINNNLLILSSIIVFIIFVVFSNFLFALIISGLIIFIPKYLEYKKKKDYLQKFNDQLVDSVDLIANSLRAGLTFQQALNVLIEEVPPPLSLEFKEVLSKHRLGVTLENALLELSQKNKNENLDLLVTTVIITKETGGNLAEVLNKVAGSIREKSRLEGQVKVLTAQGKLSGWIVGLLPFILTFIIYLIDPDLIIPMFTDIRGILMVVVAIIMEITGILFIRKIVNIDI
ncbi:MAG: type II secretion system F family protein [Candidatus Firestonebacteria bacterium]